VAHELPGPEQDHEDRPPKRARIGGADREHWLTFDVVKDGTFYGHIKFGGPDSTMSAHCRMIEAGCDEPKHGKLCRLNRTTRAGRAEAQAAWFVTGVALPVWRIPQPVGTSQGSSGNFI
jgi:hypothetical protein